MLFLVGCVPCCNRCLICTVHTVFVSRDTFEFVSKLKDLSVPSNGYMCSFDVVSLFTNVPLLDTIDICSKAL